MSILLIAFLLQYFAVSFAGSPWATPDFVVLGMVLSLARSPQRWLFIAAAVAGMMLLWAIRFSALLAVGTLGLGALLAWAAGRWDFSDRRVLLIAVGSAALSMNGLMIWSEDLWTWMTVLLLGTRVFLTAVCFYCVYPFWKKFIPASYLHG